MSETREGAERKVLKRLKRKLLRGLAYLLCLVEVAMVGTIIRILWLRMHGQGGTNLLISPGWAIRATISLEKELGMETLTGSRFPFAHYCR